MRNAYTLSRKELKYMLWKPIEDYEDYLVSECGDVFSKKTDKFLKHSKTKKGYHRVGSGNKSDKYKDCLPMMCVHKIVALAFVPNPNNYTDVHHKDGNKDNNHYTNLEWVDHKKHTEEHCKTRKVCQSKPVLMFDLEGNFEMEFNSTAQASKYLGTSQGNIYSACVGYTERDRGCGKKKYYNNHKCKCKLLYFKDEYDLAQRG